MRSCIGLAFNLATTRALVLRTCVTGGAVLALAGCGRDTAESLRRGDSTTFAAIRAESATAVAVSALPPSSVWDIDRVSRRLVRSGVAPRRMDPAPAVPDFFATATASAGFVVGRDGELRVFVFSDSLARKRVTDALDPRTASPRGQPQAWPVAVTGPTLIVNNNLVAVLFGGMSSLHERVQLGLEAGVASY